MRDLCLVLLILLTACRSEDRRTSTEHLSHAKLKEPLIQVNRQRADKEARVIEKFIKRRNWPMQKSGTGLWYMIYEKGEGKLAENGDIAYVKYTISLLDGTLCYQTKENEIKPFKVGRDNVESGIHEGITYMHGGDKARFIIPTHLAHGLTGDLNKIPPQSTLLVELELLHID